MTAATTPGRAVEQHLRAFGLLPAEYERILAGLGREPNLVELGMLGAMWSEHCGYKHSRKLLKALPTSGPRVLQGPGENAGAVDIGDGLAVVLKMESHNHPSAVEPFQGAATGVGGILRDIFTMGARPVALLDSLRFGDPLDARTRHLLNGVIGGIGHYGNCIGVPTVGGEISFDAGYAGNPIVNAMCVGVAPHARLTRAAASGPGNPLLLVGADTGRDGLQGAAFASNDDPEASHRGVVQVGNPFLEKLLLEACLGILETDAVLAMQDLGAAGLTSSAIEMAARGGLGVCLDVARVPRRESGLSAFEVMLSESQERMLVLVRAGREAEVARHFARWDLHAAVIGQVTDDQRIRVLDAGQAVADLPIALLTDAVPEYDLAGLAAQGAAAAAAPGVSSNAGDGRYARTADVSAPADLRVSADAARAEATARRSGGAGEEHSKASDLGERWLRLLGSPDFCSRRFAFRQYDSTVQGNTVFGPGQAAAAVIRVEGTRKGLALTTDCNPRYMRLDPRRGAAQAVAEAARNLACVGATPIAVTDCLNFGNPERPLVAWQLTEAVHGLVEACQALDVPIVSGNVSLYNETAGQPIPPTPAVGMVGLLDDVHLALPLSFQPDCVVILLGKPARHGDDRALAFDLAAERRLGETLRTLAARRLLRSAQDVSDGGLAVVLAECVLAGGVGATVTLAEPLDITLFAEDQARAVVTCVPTDVAAVVDLARRNGVPAQAVGATGGPRLVVANGLDVGLDDLRRVWESELP